MRGDFLQGFLPNFGFPPQVWDYSRGFWEGGQQAGLVWPGAGPWEISGPGFGAGVLGSPQPGAGKGGFFTPKAVLVYPTKG